MQSPDYPHPSYPGPVSVAQVARAKAQFVDKICSSPWFAESIRRISANPKASGTYTLYASVLSGDPPPEWVHVDHPTEHELTAVEHDWSEVLERVYRALGPIGDAHGRVEFFADYRSWAGIFRLKWN